MLARLSLEATVATSFTTFAKRRCRIGETTMSLQGRPLVRVSNDALEDLRGDRVRCQPEPVQLRGNEPIGPVPRHREGSPSRGRQRRSACGVRLHRLAGLLDERTLVAARDKLNRVMAETPDSTTPFGGFGTKRAFNLLGRSRAFDPLASTPWSSLPSKPTCKIRFSSPSLRPSPLAPQRTPR